MRVCRANIVRPKACHVYVKTYARRRLLIIRVIRLLYANGRVNYYYM